MFSISRIMIASTVLLGLSFTTQAQDCYRPVFSFQMAPGGFDIAGMATINQDQAGQLTVTFNSDFSTAGGPDVHVFLSNSFTAPNDNNPDKLEIGSLQSTSGAQTYTVPAGVAIDDYNWLLIHCITYNHFWGGGEFGMMEGNCVTTGIDTPDETDPVIIFSSNGILTIQNIPENTHHIAVFNLFGQQLLSQSFANGIPTSLLSYPVERPDEFIIVRISTPEKEFSYKVLTH